MSSIREDTIGGFNSFLEDQVDQDGSSTVTLVEFANSVDVRYEGMAIEGADRLSKDSYTPGGGTALYDAIVTGIENTASFIEGVSDGDGPQNVVVVVLTDGKENSSETSQGAVRERVQTAQRQRDWEFLFIGANQDAALTAEGMGIDRQNSLDMDHSGDGTRAAYESTSEAVEELRTTGSMEGFDEDDRQRQEDIS